MPRTRNQKGFSLVELMIVVAIFVAMMTAVYAMLTQGQSAWLTTDVQVQLQQDLRQTVEKISKELRETGSDSGGTMQVTIFDGTGAGGSDILRFSMPVICQTGGSVINESGDVANWGAPLTWGCSESSCMDADDACLTVEYKYVEYRIDADNQLLRRVLDASAATVRQDIFAQNITDMQAVLSGNQNRITLTVTAQRSTDLNRLLSSSQTMEIFLRNRG